MLLKNEKIVDEKLNERFAMMAFIAFFGGYLTRGQIFPAFLKMDFILKKQNLI
tara:strand:- start:109 stop:267 length:159 start_codon:yes stop_codon:yes gene_type:complete